MAKIYISEQLGTAYKLENGTLMFSPLMVRVGKEYLPEMDSIFIDEWDEVGRDLVGEELVEFNHSQLTFNQVWDIITEYLQA